MKDDEPPLDFLHLNPDEVDEIIHTMDGKDAIIVGGQALGIWCDLLFDEGELDEIGGPVTSKDMDYFGSKELAGHLAEQLGGRVEYPDATNTVTPQNAIVLYEREGRTIQIDILGAIAGLTNAELQDNYLTTGYDERSSIRILHPMHVLETRIAGIVTLRRRDPSAIRQMRIAPHVLQAFLQGVLDTAQQYLDTGLEEDSKVSMREAQRYIRNLIHIGSNSELDAIYSILGVDLLDHAEAMADHPMWHERFRDAQIISAIARGRERRDARISERLRKDPKVFDGEFPD